MYRLKRILVGLIAAGGVIFLGAGAAYAASNNQVQVVSGVTNSSVYKAGSSVTITGTVNGDVYCAGQTVDINATVNGDVICAGQTVNINGTVNGSVRAAGQSVNVGATVTKSLSVAGQQATLTKEASVGNDATFLAQSADVEGSVARDLHGTVAQLTLDGSVGRDVSVGVNTLNLNDSAKIGRNLSYTGPNNLKKSGGAVISGTTYYTYSKHMKHASSMWGMGFLLFQLGLVVSLIVLGLVLVAFFPQLFNTWDKRAAAQPWKTLLVGFVASILLAPVILILALTLFGLPLAIILAAASLVAYMFGIPLSAYFVGRRILRNKTSAPLVVILGSVILGIVFFIPILGEIIATFAVWYGFGVVLVNVKNSFRRPDYQV